jgi:uncharacterized membrane protein YeaQ/YmgE (transglycosylase-associated protein family)
MLIYLIVLVFWGLILGALARLALPGRDPMSLPQTILVGIGGSLIGGIISRLLFGGYYGLILAFACAFGIVYLIRRSRGGDLTHPGARR